MAVEVQQWVKPDTEMSHRVHVTSTTGIFAVISIGEVKLYFASSDELSRFLLEVETVSMDYNSTVAENGR